MTKKEIIWREIIFYAIEKKKVDWTQQEIAQKYGFSLSTVFNALKAPRNLHTIKVGGRGFHVVDVEKFLYLWATHRNMGKEIIYQTHSSKSVREMEGEMPPKVFFGAFSAYYMKYGSAPADYDKVYVYTVPEDLAQLKLRFPPEEGYKNLIVLRADPWLENFGKVVSDPQTFVDLWNLPEWYAKDFLNALKNKLLQ